ncbi:MAG: 50S ribosomal protein L16 [Candidatus Aenigmarchaeota archaeon]|nr:50S ribosomal protein L16 [Candidatus Aenigmarchaeota archaeon]
MALRPARCYRRLERPNTRISKRKPRRSYVKGVPALKIHRFETGKPKPHFTLRMFLVSKNPVQIRHNALEAGRVALSKSLAKLVGEDTYFLKVLIYPHHVLRENPLATGAGADRFQTGMRKSFGRPVSAAARVRSGQRIIEIRIPPGQENSGKKALKIASSKMPTACSIEIDRHR